MILPPDFAELDERAHRIAGRAAVGLQLVVDALLGKAGIVKTLAETSPAEREALLRVARDWDRDDSQENEPGPHQLHKWSEEWQRLCAARGPEA